jgi:hypothetical protein
MAPMARFLFVLFVLFMSYTPICCGPETTPAKRSTEIDQIDLSTWGYEEEVKPKRVINPDSGNATYAITVATFTGPHHAAAARDAASLFVLSQPTIGRMLVVRPRRRGSVLTYGSYTGYVDPRVKEDMKALRNVRLANSQPAFGQMIISKFRSPRSMQSLHPYDLWTVRRDYPTVVPIYTLDVAIWGDFESGQLPKKQRRKLAEQYAASLRSKGFESYFYHDDEKNLSSVTVGLFDHNAVDAETGFYSWEVDSLISQFPKRLVNGEELLELRNVGDPSLGMKAQQPRLVEVPID